MIGGSRLQRELAPLRAVARSDLPVVLVGATGTGKERFASAIHHWSERTGPLHAVNCAALPVALAESELFGHERGAFTGADLKTRGHFRAADGGTLFLDELQELPSSLQAKVLRAVELKHVTPLGDSRSVAYDSRIVVASQRPLSELVAEGRFRADLAMRLSGITIAISRLEQRRVDVPSLFDHFLREHASGSIPVTTGKFFERLCLHTWPGNIRELELLARRMLALHAHKTLSLSELPDEFSPVIDQDDPTRLGFQSRDEEDLHVLNAALARTGGNVKRAAELANLSRARAYRLLGKRPTPEQPASE
jgi:two-component system response regulator GlrR